MNHAVCIWPTESNEAASQDYSRIERAISYLQNHFLEQPDLAELARSVHLSEFHFQRLFTRWAGVSPKRFLQFLTIEHAKRRLADSESLLDATFNSGLSSPSRLHDLFVAVEAITPGEFKTCGAGIRIEYGFHPTRFGTCLIGVTARGVCWLSFVAARARAEAIAELRQEWSGATLSEETSRTTPIANQIFSGLGAELDKPLSLLLMGTNFQIKVWRALLTIPPGALATYESIGKLVGRGQSSRAVGSAVARNAIAYLIPCHRVIRKSGALGGYRWGEARKHAMLGWEAARCFAKP